MELIINVDAADKTAAAVISTTTRTPIEDPELLVAGNTIPVSLSFCDSDGNTPSWVTDPATVVDISLGYPTFDGGSDLTTSTNLPIVSTTRAGELAINTPRILSWMASNAINRGCFQLPNTVLYFEVRKTTANDTVTLLMLRMLVAYRVMPSLGVDTSGAATAAVSIIVNDDTTDATMYPVWVTANSGTLPLKVSSGSLSFNPSTGRLTTTSAVLGGMTLAANTITNVSTLVSQALNPMLIGTGTFGTSITIASATGIPTFSTDVVFSGTTLSVPDAFNLSSAGSITLTAGGSAKNVTIRPSTTGILDIVRNTNAGVAATSAASIGIHLTGADTGGASVYLESYSTGATFFGSRTNGTQASPSVPTNGNPLATFGGFGYTGSGYPSAPNGFMRVQAVGSWTSTNTPSSLTLDFTPLQVSDNASTTSALLFGGPGPWAIFNNSTAGYARSSQWLEVGVGLVFNTTTFTDTSGTGGTVASTAIHAFRAPTVQATVNTTFTDLGTLLVAAPVTSNSGGGTVTATNLYGIINKSQTKNTGSTLQVGTSLTQYGATALGNIGVSADTTAGILQIKSPTSGTITLTTANALSLTLSGGAAATITGGAGNMTITSGTGNSRTLTLQTTTSGGTATNALVLSATQNATFGGSITTSTPNGGTAGAWKFGILVTTASIFDTTRYIQLDVGGTLYKLATCT